MSAYSFKPRFVDPIRAGTKTQTIRAVGKRRHARVGEPMQLYCGMRTRHCFKIIEDPICARVDEVHFNLTQPRHPALVVADRVLVTKELDPYARLDGFADFAEMVDFWLKEHGPNRFKGHAYVWRPA